MSDALHEPDPTPAKRPDGFPARMRAVRRHLLTGLALLGHANIMAWLALADAYDRQAEAARRSEPPQLPPGHPEKLVPHLAPSNVELALWSQFSRPEPA